jgi:hypothetical protein
MASRAAIQGSSMPLLPAPAFEGHAATRSAADRQPAERAAGNSTTPGECGAAEKFRAGDHHRPGVSPVGGDHRRLDACLAGVDDDIDTGRGLNWCDQAGLGSVCQV